MGLEHTATLTRTENDALTYSTTLSPVLDFFGQGGALRTRPADEVTRMFSKAFATEPLLALKVLFYLRDVRGGQGERQTFRTCLKWLASNHKAAAEKNVVNVPFYGRWDDLFALVGTPLEEVAFKAMHKQLQEDWTNLRAKKPVSLLAKWLKSENTSSKTSVELARKFRHFIGVTPKKYRKTLSTLRRYINVVEVKMCAGDWAGIDFEHVSSKAALNYRKAFFKHDKDGYEKYLKLVEAGKAKMNAGAVYPYEILRSILSDDNEVTIRAADAQWKAMPNFLEGNDHYGLVIADVSGSMDGLPLLVSISLAVYFAERNLGPFKDVFMTFSNHPKLQRIVGANLKEKWVNFNRSGWDMNTNLQAAFDEILNVAQTNKVPQKDMPTVLYVISDMEFDGACEKNDQTNFEVMKKKFQAAGYELPKVVWWNVDSRNDNCPIRFDETGTALVSGCSPSILKAVLANTELTPMGTMLEAVNGERYDRVVV
jgi:hypothetical protein